MSRRSQQQIPAPVAPIEVVEEQEGFYTFKATVQEVDSYIDTLPDRVKLSGNLSNVFVLAADGVRLLCKMDTDSETFTVEIEEKPWWATDEMVLGTMTETFSSPEE